ncbi:MAG: hypothetical protein ABIS51_05765 [Sphingomonas sp.]
MRQIEAAELRHIISFEIKQLGKSTLKDLASHGDTRSRAIALVTDRIIYRMCRWEIIVPDVAGNIFQTIGGPVDHRGTEKGPT